MNVRHKLKEIINPLNIQTVDNAFTSFIAVNSSIASIIAPFITYFELLPLELTLPVSMAIALLPATIFSAADTYCHRYQSESFEHKTDIEFAQENKKTPLTPIQLIMLELHYVHDIAENMFPWITLNETIATFGFYKPTNITKASITFGLFAKAAIGTYQDKLNSQSAMEKANSKKIMDEERLQQNKLLGNNGIPIADNNDDFQFKSIKFCTVV